MAATERDPNREGNPHRDAWPEKPCGLWQWEHRSGFKDYDETTCERIEKAYQHGEPYVRLKTGKMKQTPMELFFVDMIQHDPITGNQRRIRRTGRDTCWSWVCRKMGELVYCIETGRKYRMRFQQYVEARRELLKDLDKQDHSEADLYRNTGCCARIARSGAFVGLTGLLVLMNTVWLGFDANYNKAPTIWQADYGFQLVEISFCIAFFAEMLIRFGALRRKRDFARDGWFLFDSTLVVIMVGENLVMLPIYLMSKDNSSSVSVGDMSILRIARLIRLTRLTRVCRLLRFAPEVLTMLKGITLALRSVFVTIVLLVMLLYLFGIIFTIGSKSYPGITLFPRVDDAMWVLLLQGTFLDEVAGVVVMEIKDISYVLTTIFVIFILLSNITLLNMLVGILCEVAVNVSKREKEQSAVGYLKNNLLEILEVHDKNDDRHINRDDFELLMRNPEMHMILTNFGVDTEDLVSLKGILFEGKTVKTVMTGEKLPTGDLDESTMGGPALGTVSKVFPTETKRLRFAEFLEVVLRLRGGNGASVRDIVDLREYLRQRMDHLEVQLPSQPSCLQTNDSQTLRMAGATEECIGPPSPSEDSWSDMSAVVLRKLVELREDLQTMSGQIQRLEQARATSGANPETSRADLASTP